MHKDDKYSVDLADKNLRLAILEDGSERHLAIQLGDNASVKGLRNSLVKIWYAQYAQLLAYFFR